MTNRVVRAALAVCGAAALALTAGATPADAARFRSDDPIATDPDREPIAKPQSIELSNLYDFLEHTFAHRPKGEPPPAENVNTLGEVPDSSWFTNRIGARAMDMAEFVAGPRSGKGPDTSAPWTVTRGKVGGITPGFTIKDARGDTYFIKFDPKKYPRLSGAADVISSLFFHAIGFDVPENYIAYFRRDQLKVAPDAQVRSAESGKKRKMTEADLDRILKDVLLLPNGTRRAIASKLLSGEPLGPRKFFATRSDDPNDLFAHQNRRELRGLRLFSAWLNHDDSRSINSLDMFVREKGAEKGWVKHYLIDFSSTLGSGSTPDRRIAPQDKRAGNEYILEKGPALCSAFTLGICNRSWRGVHYKVYPSVGRFESKFYRPEKWRPEYPNPAFERMRSADAFWAARIISRFDDTMVRAAVKEGDLGDAEAERYLAATLIERRNKTVNHYFRELNPLADFVVRDESGPTLAFANLGAERKLARVDSYSFEWFELGNQDGKLAPLGVATSGQETQVVVPRSDAEYLMVRIRTVSPEKRWGKGVSVYLRNRPVPTVVGIEREE